MRTATLNNKRVADEKQKQRKEVKVSYKSGPTVWNPKWEGQSQPAQEQAAEPEQAVNEQLWDPGDGHADDEQVMQLE